MINYIELFAGIGGFHKGFDSNKEFNSVFATDIDKYCKITYDYNFQNNLYLCNIRYINAYNIPDHDILTAGFPCQPFSVAGHQNGFDDKHGNLFFEIIRILKVKKPRCFILENVANLKNHDNGRTFRIIYNELSKLGYNIKYSILNTSDYNIPQNRKRIYIIGFLNINNYNTFNFPERIELTSSISDLLSKYVDNKYYYDGKQIYYDKLKDSIKRKDRIYQYRRTYVRENKSGLCPTLTANMGTGGNNIPIIFDNKGIRKLTPRECFNFQGFPIEYKLPDISDSQLYKQIGNSISVKIIELIVNKIMDVLYG